MNPFAKHSHIHTFILIKNNINNIINFDIKQKQQNHKM